MESKPRSVAIVFFGPVGAGKSTASRELAARLISAAPAGYRVRLLAEPTDAIVRLGLLGDLAEGAPGSGLQVQVLVFGERMRDAAKPVALPEIAVCDGHAALDTPLYVPGHIAAGRMSGTDVCILNALHNAWAPVVPAHIREPALFVYLRPDPAECLRRCRERGRKGEEGLDVRYFASMCRDCDAAADDLPRGRLLRVPGALSVAQTVDAVMARIQALPALGVL